MEKVYYSYEKSAGDSELFQLIYRAATHAFAKYEESMRELRLTGPMRQLRLTVLFGGCNMICLASRESDLYRNYNDAEDRRNTERIMDLRRIVHPIEGGNVINYYDEYLCIEAVVNQYDAYPELKSAFMGELEKVLTTTDNFCLINQA